MATWQPLNDNILVLPLIEADRTSGGILLAEATRSRPQQGVVVAVGEGAYDAGTFVSPTLVAGDLVTFGKYAGVDFEIDGQPVLLMREREAMARKPAGTYTLIEHNIPHGLSVRTVAHEAGQVCEHCPKPAPSAVIAEERARLVLGSLDEPAVIGDGTGVR